VNVGGQAVLGYVFNSDIVDGEAGLFTRGGASSFSGYTVKTDDAKFATKKTSAMTGEMVISMSMAENPGALTSQASNQSSAAVTAFATEAFLTDVDDIGVLGNALADSYSVGSLLHKARADPGSTRYRR
jgi:hypothetical protein